MCFLIGIKDKNLIMESSERKVFMNSFPIVSFWGLWGLRIQEHRAIFLGYKAVYEHHRISIYCISLFYSVVGISTIKFSVKYRNN